MVKADSFWEQALVNPGDNRIEIRRSFSEGGLARKPVLSLPKETTIDLSGLSF